MKKATTNSKTRPRTGRPARQIDPAILATGRVDTYSRMSDLTGIERDRRVLWERQRKQRQKEARGRVAHRAAVGDDLLAKAHGSQPQSAVAASPILDLPVEVEVGLPFLARRYITDLQREVDRLRSEVGAQGDR